MGGTGSSLEAAMMAQGMTAEEIKMALNFGSAKFEANSIQAEKFAVALEVARESDISAAVLSQLGN